MVEGVRVGKEAKIGCKRYTYSVHTYYRHKVDHIKSMGTCLERAVVIPGTKEKSIEGGKIFTSCAYIIGERKESTDKKTSLNNVLREFHFQYKKTSHGKNYF